jgi:methylated-DNA-[protein]-cysteine S-methyltransferase
MPHLSLHSPIGDLTIFEEDGRLVALNWRWESAGAETPLLAEARHQLQDYFAGRRRDFDLPLNPAGSAFQRRAWLALRDIPFGQTRRYGDLAQLLGSAPRAIGSACARNPLPIIVPCHRVIAADGSLGGYSGKDGIKTKRFLLDLEGAAPR